MPENNRTNSENLPAEKPTKPLIVYIHHGSIPGGAPTSLRNLTQGFMGNGFVRCRILCMHDSMRQFFAENHKVEIASYPKHGLISGRVFMAWTPPTPGRLMLTLLEVISAPKHIAQEIKVLRQHTPDIVHLNSSILWTSAIATKILRLPVIWHIREASAGRSIMRALYTRLVRRLADHVICIGPQEYHIFDGETHANVHQIRNSLDDSYFVTQSISRQEARKQLGIPEDRFVFASLGGSSFRKGPLQLLEALHELPQDYSLLLAGSRLPSARTKPAYPWHAWLMRLEESLWRHKIKQCILWYYPERLALALASVSPNRITMTGIINDVKPVIMAADVLVFAGTTPHSGRPLYEAWALGKPVIVFDSEVMRKEVVDAKDGLIIYEHTGKALAKALKRLRSDPKLARHLGENGRKKAEKLFSLQTNTDKLAEIYRKVFDANRIDNTLST